MVNGNRWWWLRHAPVRGPEGRITGRLDWEADTSDRVAIFGLAARLPKQPVLIVSALERCRQTVDGLVRSGHDLPEPAVEAAFNEQNFGAWEGRTWDELERERDPHLDRFWKDPAGTSPPGGESFTAMAERVAGAIQRLDARHAGRDIVVVAHAGTVRAALIGALGIAPATALAFAVDHLSLTRLERTETGWRVAEVNWRAA